VRGMSPARAAAVRTAASATIDERTAHSQREVARQLAAAAAVLAPRSGASTDGSPDRSADDYTGMASPERVPPASQWNFARDEAKPATTSSTAPSPLLRLWSPPQRAREVTDGTNESDESATSADAGPDPEPQPGDETGPSFPRSTYGATRSDDGGDSACSTVDAWRAELDANAGALPHRTGTADMPVCPPNAAAMLTRAPRGFCWTGGGSTSAPISPVAESQDYDAANTDLHGNAHHRDHVTPGLRSGRVPQQGSRGIGPGRGDSCVFSRLASTHTQASMARHSSSGMSLTQVGPG